MNNSLVYCVDNSFSIKVLDCTKIITEKMNIINDHLERPKKLYSTEIEQNKLISNFIPSQKKIVGNNKIFLDTYLYSIIEYEDNNSSLVILGENKIYLVNLVDWLFFLENLLNKKDFINLFSVGIEIYKGNMACFSNLPEEKIKKEKIIEKLKPIVCEYIIINMQDNKSNKYLLYEKENQEKIGFHIKTVIETLIEIDSFDFLMKSILPVLESEFYDDLFFKILQSFILCDKIKNKLVSSDIILNLIDLYNKKDKLDILSQILLHININSLDTSEIRQKLEELNLISPLIYLYMNGKNENYIAPLEKMFEIFYSKEKSNKDLIDDENNIYDYSSALTQRLVTEKEVRESKEFNGHKILWYIKLCLRGRKFPDDSIKIDKNLFENLVPKITYWLLNPKVIEEFLKFDPTNYFIIFKNIFSTNDLKKLIIDSAKDDKYSFSIKGLLSSSGIKIDNIEPDSLIKYMVSFCKKLNQKKIYFYLYDFIIYILSTNIVIEKELKKETICFILKNFKEKDNNSNDNTGIKLMEKNLINSIEREKSFNESDYKIILESIIDNEFNEIKLCLLNKLNKFNK